MRREDVVTRDALATSFGDLEEEGAAPLLPKRAPPPSAHLSPSKTFKARLAHVEGALSRATRSGTDRKKELYLRLSREELQDLYESPEFSKCKAFELLDKIHFVAPPLIKYNVSTPIATLFRFKSTGVDLVLQRPDFWILLGIHVAISLSYFSAGHSASNGIATAENWPKFGTSLVAIPGGLLTFVLVFYLNQTFTRYLTQGSHVFNTAGLLSDFVMMLRVHLGDHLFKKSIIVRHQLCKLAIALHFLAYASLPQNQSVNVNEWAWFYLKQQKLLKEAQVEELRPLQAMGCGNLVYKEILMWLDRGVWAQHSRGHIDVEVANLFSAKLLQVRAHLDVLYTFVDGTVPFAYFHLLNFIIMLYLLLLAYAFAFLSPYWSIPVFTLILIGLLGIREIGNNLSNPLGSDSTDLPVFQVARAFHLESAMLINKVVPYGDEIRELMPMERVHSRHTEEVELRPEMEELDLLQLQ